MTDEPLQLPVYIVTGVNWTMEVPMDEYNAQFDVESQVAEAATRAVEVFMRIRNDLTLVMNPDCRDENSKPGMGTSLLVHLKDTNPDNAIIVFSHVCLGNSGFYKHAKDMKDKLDEQMAQMKKREKEREAAKQKEIAEFEGLAKEIKKNKSRKPKK